jgi:hypothetical protein
MTGSAGLLEAPPRHQTAHATLLADILDVLHGASPVARQQSSPPPAEELSPASRTYCGDPAAASPARAAPRMAAVAESAPTTR